MGGARPAAAAGRRARAVFVAFRDSPELGEDSPYASEGIVQWPALAGDGGVIARPAYWALLGLAAAAR